MPFSGTGVFNRLYSWAADAAAALKISSSRMDAEFNGIAAGLTNCMTRDGQSPATANIPMGGFKLTGLANATVSTDAVAYGQADGRYAQLAGISTQTFNVANATLGPHAINLTTGDGRYGQLATTNTWALAQTFNTKPLAVNYGFTASTGEITADVSNMSINVPNGGKLFVLDIAGTRRTVECADALSNTEAVTLGQGDARYNAKANLVFGTFTTALVAAGASTGTEFDIGLGTDDIDFDAILIGEGTGDAAARNIRGYIGGFDRRFKWIGNPNAPEPAPTANATTTGFLYFSLFNNANVAQAITVKWWARKRV